MAVEAGASALGLVSEMPSGPGVIDDESIAAVAGWAPRGVETFLLTSRRAATAIAAQHARAGTTTIQLVDALPPDELEALRGLLPGVTIVQVIHVRGPEAVEEALAVEDRVDAILLDSGNPDLAVKELGGTGRTHDWRWSRRIVERTSRPVWLAGGLRPGNVRDAIEAVGPYGLDVCSGVRGGGGLDPERLRRFMGAVSDAS